MNTNCAECSKPMRPARATKDEYPGTVLYGADGLCKTCRRRQNPTRPTTPERCVQCGTKLRPKATKASDYPGTLEYHADGLCNTCYRRRLRAEYASGERVQDVSPPPADPVWVERRPGVAENRASLETWLNTYYRPRARARAAA